MTQDLQQLLDKIQRDGVDKAQAEADKRLSVANAQAKAILDEAHAKATAIKANARLEAESFENRAEETIRQAARDTVLNVEKAVTRLLEHLLLKDVEDAFDRQADVVGDLAAEAVRAYVSGGDGIQVAAAAKLADVLRAKLAALAADKGVDVVTDETAGTGFLVRLADGRIEHAFTGRAIAEALARQLRPRLAAIMKS